MAQFTLTNEQQLAFENILTWADSYIFSEKGKILSGFAGTGKTTLIKLIAKELPKTVLCAPTNKAVRVLDSLNTGRDCQTIYSLLGLQMQENEDKLRLVKIEKDNLSKYEYVIIDEASMLNSELLDYIDEACEKYDIKFLFVGDPEQLNPVNEEVSPIWNRFSTEKLQTVMRHDNHILNLATHIRQTDRFDFKSAHNGKDGVFVKSQKEFEEEIIKSAINGDFFEDAKAIAWRNSTVAMLNNFIRWHAFGEVSNSSNWLKGEKIVFTDRYRPVKSREIITDEEGYIKISDTCLHPDYGFKCYFLTIELDSGNTIEALTLHENDRQNFENTASELASLAQKNPKKWKDFWDFKKSTANLRHAYAITAHRSQGSTFRDTFIDVKDILLNKNSIEAKRCLYVASTRASRRVYLKI